MTETATRLRGENLTLGYGKKNRGQGSAGGDPRRPLYRHYRPNGCGKSTLLRTLSRLMTPLHGNVFLDGEQIQRFASKEVARRVGLLAQNATTPGDITVQELVARGRYPHQPLFTRWRKEDEAAVAKAMQATGITDLAAQSVDTPLRRATPAGVDCNGAGPGDVNYAAGRTDHLAGYQPSD
ncbi:Probable siderophore transport system ATP-binding protein YusV [Leclercia adecarboxylata]|uniref:Probable siderophore transport system ATP-binding protein YusV n=1 Tax=Leclercia adecarboxylata TaxID=83655 RepID=A0A4U9HLH9_9ENTR|nr:Probable siderophore transport system ATP-binding protein YusV [Leclercia adecarboxylata]